MGNSQRFRELYKKATKRPYGYFLVDNHPRTSEAIHFRTHLLFSEPQPINILQSLKSKTMCSERGQGKGMLHIPCNTTGPPTHLWQRLTDQTQDLREGTLQIRWRLGHPRPTLKQSLAEKGTTSQVRCPTKNGHQRVDSGLCDSGDPGYQSLLGHFLPTGNQFSACQIQSQRIEQNIRTVPKQKYQ